MTNRNEPLEVYFYQTPSGNEPVKEWLKSLPREDMRTIGYDIKTVQFGYPIGMPLTRILHGTNGLEEVRCNISNGIAFGLLSYVIIAIFLHITICISRTSIGTII